MILWAKNLLEHGTWDKNNNHTLDIPTHIDTDYNSMLTTMDLCDWSVHGVQNTNQM